MPSISLRAARARSIDAFCFSNCSMMLAMPFDIHHKCTWTKMALTTPQYLQNLRNHPSDGFDGCDPAPRGIARSAPIHGTGPVIQIASSSTTGTLDRSALRRVRLDKRMNTHPVGWKLELYVLGRLGSPESRAVVKLEEHLLECTRCIDQAERATEFAQAVRAALANTPAGIGRR